MKLIKFLKKPASTILYSICLVVCLGLSSDSFPEYEWFRYAIVFVGIIACIRGNKRIMTTITVLEFLICFPVIIQKINKGENEIVLESQNAKKEILERLQDCSKYKKEWALSLCESQNFELKKFNHPMKEKILNEKISVSAFELVRKFPSMIAFIFLSFTLPIIAMFAIEGNKVKPVLQKVEIKKPVIDKNETIQNILTYAKKEKKSIELSCVENGLAYSTFKRWKKNSELVARKSEPKMSRNKNLGLEGQEEMTV